MARGSGVIDEDATHHLGDHGKKLCPVLPHGVPLIDQTEIRLVHQCGWLQGVSRAFAAQMRSGATTQFAIHEGHRPIAGLRDRPQSRRAEAPSPLDSSRAQRDAGADSGSMNQALGSSNRRLELGWTIKKWGSSTGRRTGCLAGTADFVTALQRRRRILQSRSDRPLRRFVPHIQESTIARGRNSASAFPGRAVQR